jgi:hypothetical protein
MFEEAEFQEYPVLALIEAAQREQRPEAEIVAIVERYFGGDDDDLVDPERVEIGDFDLDEVEIADDEPPPDA